MNQPTKGATLSSESNLTQYQIGVEANQPSGGTFNVQLTLNQESDFGDAEAQTMLAGIAALVPSSWPIYTSMTKMTSDVTLSQWNATTKAFE